MLAVLTWLVIVRGIKSIGRAAEKLSPLKVGLYLIGGAIVIVSHIYSIAGTFWRWCFTKHISTQAAVRWDGGLRVMMGHALWHRSRRVRKRGRLRHGGGGVRHRKEPAARAARAGGHDGSVHHFVRYVVD